MLKKENLLHEVLTIGPDDTFLVFERIKDNFDYPVHYHPEFELNFIYNGKGVRRVVGTNMEEIGLYEMVLVGPNLPHCWEMHHCKSKEIHEITIQFHNDLFAESFLNRRVAKPIKDLFERAKQGVLFSEEAAKRMFEKLSNLSKDDTFESNINFLSIIYQLSISENQRLLNSTEAENINLDNNSRFDTLYQYLLKNFHKKITLADAAEAIKMSPISFNRYIKKHTNKTFVDFLNDIRIGFACLWLLEKELSIAEIAYKCGFNNIANFNRVFKKIKNNTPSSYRDDFSGIKKVL
ncbi:MAG: AraC family transcriptional regulator [Flavobacteriales bacterium CG_4_9_14_3_um_filter_40_17]|nr:MAG: AraC family transcriptional regulator [Flavobacteriales bacterium CG_4_9_14_3_um_filter_40_17]